MANFAPYQDIPERTRALSPPIRSPTISPRPHDQQPPKRNIGTSALNSPINQGQGEYFSPGAGWRPEDDVEQGGVRRGFGGGREHVDLFETRLGIRVDWEACLAYLALPPVGGVLLLILEHKSDYVRFHAWQASLLFTFMLVVHVIFSWSSILSWLIFAGDLGLIGRLVYKAYTDAATLDRYEIPFFGPLATSILDDE
ncbi:Serine/threonine-protein kinase prp4 [Venturia nashicola]|uniref:Serine/threonine-protein kinase prp4 n=1 Tax=Venturia nashicola TaxID=86259 RepID=A0A4Z1PBW2_9PEZI|nr:Serine/threonine-protein kinase prp4 [Venturia nashicola]